MDVSVLVLLISALLRERLAICLVAMAFTIVTVQDAPDNRGTEFIIGYMENVPLLKTMNVELFVTTMSTTTVNVQVTAPRYSNAGINETFSVTAGTVKHLFFHPSIRLVGNEMSSKAVLVTADDEVVIYGVNKETYSCDAFLGLPTDVLGTEYYTVTYYPPSRQCELLIAGVIDRTTVNITVGDAIDSRYITWGGTKYYKGNTISVTIDRFNTFQLVTNGDLSGTYINSSKPVSVFSGNRKTSIGYGQSADHLVEHLTNVDTWGKRFVTVPVPLRTVGDYFKFIASESNTHVIISGGYSNSFILSKAGTVMQKTISSSAHCLVVSDKPILVVQFLEFPGVQSDPTMMIIPPVEQFGADYTFTTPRSSHGSYSNYFMFIIKESEQSELLVDGKAFPSNTAYNTISGTDYVGGYISLTEGTHTVRHTSPISIFGGYLYGKAQGESYGFTTGMRMATINKVCVRTTTGIGDGVDNDCDGLIDEELCTTENQGKDDDGDGKTEEDCATPPTMTSDTPPTTQSTSTAAVTFDVETTTQNTPPAVVTSDVETTTQNTLPAVVTSDVETTTQNTPPAVVTSDVGTTTQNTPPAVVTSDVETTTQTTPPAVVTSDVETTTQNIPTAVVTSDVETTTQTTPPVVVTSGVETTTQTTPPVVVTSDVETTTQSTSTAVVTSDVRTTTQTTPPAVVTSDVGTTTQNTPPAVVTSDVETTTQNTPTAVVASDVGTTTQNTSIAVVTSDVKSTTRTTPTYVVNGSCGNCCAKNNMSRQLNQEELKNAIQELKSQLAVNKTNLSANRRKRISVYDSRSSSVAIGGLAIAILAGICGVIVIPDMVRLVRSLSKGPQKCKHKTWFNP